jgi:hypothetical protein
MEAGARRSRVCIDGYPVTSGIDERSAAARTTLIGWLLVLTVVISAECAWVVWLQDAWTVTPAAAASPRSHVSPAAAHHMLGIMKNFRAPMLGVQEGTR